MYLTPEQEEALVKKYDKYVRYAVYRFKCRNNSRNSNTEDLYQEAMIVLTESFRKAESMESWRMPARDMVNAMCRYTVGEQVVSLPKRTSDYTQRISTVSSKAQLEALDFDDSHLVDTEDQVLFRVSLADFMANLLPEDRLILRLKMSGESNRAIGMRFGLSDVKMTRRIKRLREWYQEYAA